MTKLLLSEEISSFSLKKKQNSDENILRIIGCTLEIYYLTDAMNSEGKSTLTCNRKEIIISKIEEL